MSKRKRSLSFPKAPGNYWFLYWIGRIIYDKNMKVELYFVNTNRANDLHRNFSIAIGLKVSGGFQEP